MRLCLILIADQQNIESGLLSPNTARSDAPPINQKLDFTDFVAKDRALEIISRSYKDFSVLGKS